MLWLKNDAARGARKPRVKHDPAAELSRVARALARSLWIRLLMPDYAALERVPSMRVRQGFVGIGAVRDGISVKETQMPFYKEEKFFTDSRDVRFDEARSTGGQSFYDGIYSCSACGNEIVARKGERFPSCGGDHDADFTWRLVCSPKKFGCL